MKHLLLLIASFFFLASPLLGQDIYSSKNRSINLLSNTDVVTLINEKQESEKDTNKRQGIKYFNIVKVNSIALPFSNITFLYERMLIPKVSVGIGLGYKYGGAIPGILNVDNPILRVRLDKIEGYSITPYGRYYVRTCDPNILDGFYVGAYFRYTRYTSGANFNFIPTGGIPLDYTADFLWTNTVSA